MTHSSQPLPPDDDHSLPSNSGNFQDGQSAIIDRVAQPSKARAKKLPATWFRLLALSLAVLPVTLLMVARRLEPSSAGLGTHQQLGLPPCSMRLLAGIRCPGCGMTTSWAHFMRGQWASSFQVNSGGFLLALFSLAFAATALRTCFTGHYPSTAIQRAFALGLISVAAVTLADWSIRLAAG